MEPGREAHVLEGADGLLEQVAAGRARWASFRRAGCGRCRDAYEAG